LDTERDRFDQPYGSLAGEEPMRLSEYVKATVDSHGMIDLTGWLTNAKQQGVIEEFERVGLHFNVKVPGVDGTIAIFGNTLDHYYRTQRAEKVGPKGLYIEKDVVDAHRDDLCVAGWTLAEQLAKALTGDNPGGQFFGRGSAYRADMKAVADAGY
jgi:hypothetical protein